MQRFRIEFGVNAGHLQQRLDLRGEGEPVALVRVVERFDSKVIPRHEQRLGVPERRSQMANANIPFSRLTQSGPSAS